MLAAARFGDQISHTQQRSGLITGMIVGALVVGAVVLAVASGGTAIPALIAVGAVLTGAAVGGGVGRLIGGEMTVPKGAINKSAATVFINGILAARSCIDTALCQDHTLQLIATGSMMCSSKNFRRLACRILVRVLLRSVKVRRMSLSVSRREHVPESKLRRKSNRGWRICTSRSD